MAEILSPTTLVQVELFEDRAAITRRVVLPEAPGRYELVIDGLSPLLREAGLSFPDAEAPVTVESVSVTRWLEQERVGAEEEDSLRAEERALQAALVAQAMTRRRAQERADRAEARMKAGASWLNEALHDGASVEALLQSVQESAAACETLRLKAQAEGHKEEDTLNALAEAQRRIKAALNGRSRLRGRLCLGVLSRGPGALTIRYVVPCALWRPAHRATLLGERLVWEIGAYAWNTTGEDWLAAPLRLSTARPGERATPPSLSDDVLSAKPRGAVVVEARDETIQLARQGDAVKRSEGLGVDDGGEVRVYDAPEPCDLRSDGRPVTLALETFTTTAQRRWVAMPERSPQLYLRTRQQNLSRRPLLAGPVRLIRDGAAVGQVPLSLVPAGEPFDLGWGGHDAVRVTRDVTREAETSRFTGAQTVKFKVTLRLSHFGAEALSLDVRERVPVSELKEVKVSGVVGAPALDELDRDGFARFGLTLQPGELRTLTLSYTVEAPGSVTLPW